MSDMIGKTITSDTGVTGVVEYGNLLGCGLYVIKLSDGSVDWVHTDDIAVIHP